jgi:hypothetical protein
MDFLDPNKKRQHTIRLFIGYALIATALFLASVLLLFAAFGYGINRSTGEVIQNGLLFVDAHPEQATMYINGQERGQTDGRFVLEAGNYSLELKRDGYRNWKRDFTLDGGNIVRLVYPFLFPEKLVSTDVQTFAAQPDLVSASPDRRWIVIHDQKNPTQFRVLDTSTKELPTETVSIPTTVLGTRTGASKMEMVEWSTDNRHVLLKNTFAGGYDFIVFDREDPAQSYNVTQVFDKAYAAVTLRDKKFDQLYLHDVPTGDLLSGNVKDRTTAKVLEEVVAFWPYKDKTLLYTTNTDAPADKSLLRLKDGQVTYTIRELARSKAHLLNMAEFDGDTYVIGCAPVDGKIYIYKNPVDALKQKSKDTLSPTVLMKLDKSQHLSFSSNARFASIQAGSQFAVYDFETKLQYKYDTKIAMPNGYKATWMDGHRLLLVSTKNVMTVIDYDGLNAQTLVTTTSAHVPMFDRDYNRLYTVSPTVKDAKKQGLIWTDLNLGKE